MTPDERMIRLLAAEAVAGKAAQIDLLIGRGNFANVAVNTARKFANGAAVAVELRVARYVLNEHWRLSEGWLEASMKDVIRGRQLVDEVCLACEDSVFDVASTGSQARGAS